MIKNFKFSISVIISILIVFSIFNSSNALEFDINKTEDVDNILQNQIYLNAIVNESKYNIIYPLSTFPSLVEKDSNFIINFEADEFEKINVIITTSYEPVEDTILLDNINYWEENSIWQIEVNVPSSTPEELYNITLLFEKDGESYKCSQPRALNVYNKFTDNFSFIHLADLHYGDPRGLFESIKETIGFKSIKRCIKEINLLHPDFVLISGDIVFGQLYPFEYRREYQKCYDLLQTFDVPIFLVPGNHDGYNRILEDGLEYWQEYFGPLFYSFNYGDYHFTGVNSFDMSKILRLTFLFIPLNWGGSISNEQLDWVENDLESSDSALNFMFLGTISFIPFPTSLISEHPEQSLSAIVFSLTILCAWAAIIGMKRCLKGINYHTVEGDEMLRSVRPFVILTPIVTVLSFFLTFLEPQLGVWVWIILPLAGRWLVK